MTRNTDADALATLPELKNATVSPDGRRVAFYYDGTGRNELHVLDLETGESKQYSDGDLPPTNVWPLAWTADGERVLYPHDDSDGGEAYDVYAVDADGDVEPVVETDGTTKIRDVGPDGETLLVGSTHEGSLDVYVADCDSGELTRVTDEDHAVWYSHLSPSGSRVAFNAEDGARVRRIAGVTDRGSGSESAVPDGRDGGHVLDTDDDHVLDGGNGDVSVSPEDWAPGGDRLLVADDDAASDRCGVYDLATDRVEWFGGEHVEEPQYFLADGDRFVAARKRDATTVPVVYDTATGDGQELDLPEGVARFGLRANRVVDDDRLLVVHSTPTRRRELLVYDLATDNYESVFERDYGPFSSDDFVDPDYLTVPSNGVPETPAAAVDHDPAREFDVGALFYDAGVRPSPLVVYPHGGPNLSDRKAFHARAQHLCARGYSVLQVNYRGSSGRGREFAQALYGDWGGAEQGDVATAVEYVLDEYGFLDEDRVAVYGGSFGGYSACWQLVQYPELYAAGACQVAMTDLRAAYENTAPEFRSGFLDIHLGTPDENPELYRERSPVTHVENFDAPLLVLHGENDPRVPVSQARRLRDALQDAGYEEGRNASHENERNADFEYHELDGSGHFSERAGGVPEPLALLDDFLDRRL